MDLVSHLKAHREEVVTRWRELIIGTYPKDAGRFLFGKKDRFANPVGYTIESSVQRLFDGLLDGAPAAEQRQTVDEIVRIRAVQDFAPSGGVSFVFLLKQVIREFTPKDVAVSEVWMQLSSLESAIDELALVAFDSYSACRDRIHSIRHTSLQRRTHHLLELAHWQQARKEAREAEASAGTEGGESR